MNDQELPISTPATLQIEKSGEILLISINRPEKLNAMDRQTYAELDAAMAELDADPDLAVGIITGSGDRSFSAGADLKGMHGEDATPKGWGPWRHDGWSFGRTTRKPLIAAINGYALAGGLELAMTCDIRIASPNATFGAPEVKWALLHGLGATRLPGAVGLSNAMLMLLTGEAIDAEEALRIGLISRIVDSDNLLEEAHSIAEKIVAHSSIAVEMTKELAIRASRPADEEALRLYRSYFAILENMPEQSTAVKSFGERPRSNDSDT